MPKKLIAKYLPQAQTVVQHRSIQWLGSWLHDSSLWHLNRRSVASAMFAGIFASFFPLPGQMFLAACLAIYVHGNLPLSVALTWITNPFTTLPIFYVCYRFGLMILMIFGQDYSPTDMEWTLQALGGNIGAIMLPLLIGCLLAGFIFGMLGYFSVHLLWRMHIMHHWQKRKAMRAKQKN